MVLHASSVSGRGIYCTRSSSKAHDYCKQSGAMFVCRALAGKEHVDYEGDATVVPEQCDSLAGEEKAGVLNYDELVLKTAPDAITEKTPCPAIVPSHLILYRCGSLAGTDLLLRPLRAYYLTRTPFCSKSARQDDRLLAGNASLAERRSP